MQKKLSKLKQRACASLCLDPEAVELWRYDRAADTTGAEPLPGDIRVTDPAVQRPTTLLLQHKVRSSLHKLCVSWHLQ